MGSLINVQSLNRHWSVLLDQIQLQLDREGIKEREDGERGRGGGGGAIIRVFEGGDYFKYLHQRGAIIRGRPSIEGQLLLEEIR